MATAKEKMTEIIQQQPDDSTDDRKGTAGFAKRTHYLG
jgi:hypothetical protein